MCSSPPARIPPKGSTVLVNYKVIDSEERFTELKEGLSSLWPPVVGYDCEGVQMGLPSAGCKRRTSPVIADGAVTLINIFYPEDRLVAIFDCLDKTASDLATSTYLTYVKRISERRATLKVIHDCRMDSVALYDQLDISLDGVYDTSGYTFDQNSEFYSPSNYGLHGQQIEGHDVGIMKISDKLGTNKLTLNRILEKYGIQTNEARLTTNYDDEPDFWARRPLDANMIAHATGDVAVLVSLYEKMLDEYPVQQIRTISERLTKVRHYLIHQIVFPPGAVKHFMGLKQQKWIFGMQRTHGIFKTRSSIKGRDVYTFYCPHVMAAAALGEQIEESFRADMERHNAVEEAEGSPPTPYPAQMPSPPTPKYTSPPREDRNLPDFPTFSPLHGYPYPSPRQVMDRQRAFGAHSSSLGDLIGPAILQSSWSSSALPISPERPWTPKAPANGKGPWRGGYKGPKRNTASPGTGCAQPDEDRDASAQRGRGRGGRGRGRPRAPAVQVPLRGASAVTRGADQEDQSRNKNPEPGDGSEPEGKRGRGRGRRRGSGKGRGSGRGKNDERKSILKVNDANQGKC